MNETINEILKYVIPSALTLVGVIVTVHTGNKKTQALLEYRLQQVEKKQDKHNNFIERMYAVEENIKLLYEKINVANHRIDDLEDKSA